MIELLVVISVIGVLAVAVLSSINPIEQINKGRDTRTRSDAAQLINAVDRYFAIQEQYPWNVPNDGTNTSGDGYTPGSGETQYTSQFIFDGTTDDWDWIDELVSTAEVKEGFVNRLKDYDDEDDHMVMFKEGTSNATMYACFLPTSQAFKREAADNCDESAGARSTPTAPSGSGLTICATTDGSIDDANYICLP